MIPQSITDKVQKDILAYKQEHKLSDAQLADKVGVFQGQISKWRTGDSRPLIKSIARLVKAGVVDIDIAELRRQNAVTTTLTTIDNGNRVPRPYKKRVQVPSIISNQIKLLIDEHINELEQPKTYAQFNEDREELIRKVYYLCRQG
jgi:transcriptional regulator with XRE-family HTH domain